MAILARTFSVFFGTPSPRFKIEDNTVSVKIDGLKKALRIALKSHDRDDLRIKMIEKQLATTISEERGIYLGDTVRDKDGNLWMIRDMDLRNQDTIDYKGSRIQGIQISGKSERIQRIPVTKVP